MEQPIDGNRLSGGRANLVRGRWQEIESKEREGAELGLLSLAVPSKGGFVQGESTWGLRLQPCGKRGGDSRKPATRDQVASVKR
jgi:hypothetical protein